MASYKGHWLGGCIGFLLGLALLKTYGAHAPYGEWFFCTLLGAFFPDLDIRSKGRSLLTFILLLLLLSALLFRYMPLAFISLVLLIISRLVRHRGFLHSYSCLIIINFILWGMGLWFPHYSKTIMFDALFFSIGFISHRLLDGMH